MTFKNFSKITDIFAPVSSKADVMTFWTVTWQVAIFPWRDTSLMTTVSGCSQSDIGDIHLEKLLNSSIKPSSPATLWAESWINGSLCCATTAYFTSFTDSSAEGLLSCWASSFFLKLYFSPNLPQKHLMLLILTDISLPALVGCDAWNDSVPIGNIFLLVLLL